MKNRFWRIALMAALVCACALLLGGCLPVAALLGEEFNDDGGYYTGSDMRESVSEGYFKMTIHTDKDEFAKGEKIDCWAELEYIGDQDSITVYACGNPIEMDMTSGDVSYSSSSDMYCSDEKLTMKKGEPIRCTLAECLPKSASVLPGQYEIDAYAYLDLSPDGSVCYNGNVSAVIVVKE